MKDAPAITLTTTDLGKIIGNAIEASQKPLKYRRLKPTELISKKDVIEDVFKGSRRHFDQEVEAGRLPIVKTGDRQFSKVYVKNIELKKYLKQWQPYAYADLYTFDKLV